MADLKATIDEKIRKLTMLRELADDPETKELLMALVSGQNGSKPEGKSGSTRGQQKKTVYEVLKTATEAVTTDWIVEKMIERGFVFRAAKPAVAVNEALNTLMEDRLAKIERTEGVRNYWIALAA